MVLNERNDKTKKVIHLLVTSLCDRNCKYCCNKQYNLSDIPQVTDEELRECETICLTGGEPFTYAQPWEIAHKLKADYPNIKRVYVYTNATEFEYYLINNNHTCHRFWVDGYNISIKAQRDYESFEDSLIEQLRVLNRDFKHYKGYGLHNRLYIQTKVNKDIIKKAEDNDFEVIERKWQEKFIPCDDSIFRRI